MRVEEEGKIQRSSPRIKFLPASAGSRQRRAPRVSGSQSMGLGPQCFCRELELTHTLTHSPTPLCSRLEFLPGSLLALSCRSPSLRRAALSKSCTPRVRPAEGRGTPRAWPRVGLRARPNGSLV